MYQADHRQVQHFLAELDFRPSVEISVGGWLVLSESALLGQASAADIPIDLRVQRQACLHCRTGLSHKWKGRQG